MTEPFIGAIVFGFWMLGIHLMQHVARRTPQVDDRELEHRRDLAAFDEQLRARRQ